MTGILLYADESSWLQLPASFPTASGELPREWENRVISGMREAWRGFMDADSEMVVREALRHGLRQVHPEDSVTLQYWPTASVVNTIVHIGAREFAPGEQPEVVPLDEDLPYLTRPAVDAFESPFLGTGVEARYLSVVTDAEPKVVLGGVNYLFENSRGFVQVALEPTLPQLVEMMLEALREVVLTIRVDDEGGDVWEKAAFDDSILDSTGEGWDLEGAGGDDRR